MNRHQRKQFEKELQQSLKKASLLVRKANGKTNQQDLLEAGNLLATNGMWHEALACFKLINQLRPNNPELLQNLAYVFANTGHSKKAFDCYQQALKLLPQDQNCLKNICALSMEVGYLPEALKTALELRNTTPEDPEIYYLLGEIYSRLNDNEKSLSSYQQAIIHFRHQFQRIQPQANSLIKFAQSLLANNENKMAYRSLKEALKITPKNPSIHYQMGQFFEKIDQTTHAIKAYRRCLNIKEDHYETLLAYSTLMADKGDLDKRAWGYRRLLLQTPDDSSIKHLLQASLSTTAQGGADKNYVKDVFDSYAENFDDHLVNDLSYCVPEKLIDLFSAYLKQTQEVSRNMQQLHTIDLGCGTGLCGPLFKPYSKQLIGIDLSTGMLKKAAEKKCYDKLIACDLIIGLKKYPNSMQLAIAGDVFIYVGELNDVFKACYNTLTLNGLLLFSVELTASLKGLVLQPSGRYQHSIKYIKILAEKHHFSVVEQQITALRQEHGEPVKGSIFLLRKDDFNPFI